MKYVPFQLIRSCPFCQSTRVRRSERRGPFERLVLRLRLLRDYGEWREAMDECDSLWALSRLRAGEALAPEEPVEVEVLRAA